MFGAGLVAGLLGIGAGALKSLAIHDLVMGLPPKVSTTTEQPDYWRHGSGGNEECLSFSWALSILTTAVPVILGILLGAFLGTRLLVRLPNKTVRMFFLVVLAVFECGDDRSWYSEGLADASSFREDYEHGRMDWFHIESRRNLERDVFIGRPSLGAGSSRGHPELSYTLQELIFFQFWVNDISSK